MLVSSSVKLFLYEDLTFPCRSDEFIPNTLVLLDYYPLTGAADWSIEVI